MADLNNVLHTYLAQRHFDLMPADVRERFENYAKGGFFIGHMKQWREKYLNDDLTSKTLIMLDAAILDANGGISTSADQDWEKLYDACQEAFQGMDDSKVNSVGYGSPYNNPTKAFIAEWFGDDTKVFTSSKAKSEADQLFKDLGQFLENHKGDLKPRFITNLQYVFNDMKYEEFCQKLKGGKFNNDTTFRDKLESVIQYITTYGPRPGSVYPEPDDAYWPTNLGYKSANGVVTSLDDNVLKGLHNDPAVTHKIDKDNPKSWYDIPNKSEHIKWFKEAYVNIFDKLLTNTTIRNKFLEKADPHSSIRKALEAAISDTDYENKESDDFVPPEPLDEKNWRQKIKKWKNDTYENHFRRFFEHHRGARKFFSPHSQNIMKAFDKVGIKPTDGLDGILAKKDDKKLLNVVYEDQTTKRHFEWFAKTMAAIKEKIPDAFEGALRNGHQLRQVAMYVIAAAEKENEVDKAKTALEILSVAKYGLTTSRTMDKLDEAVKNMKLLNADGYSWMKHEYTKTIANAANSVLGFGIRAAGRLGAGAYNFIQHRRTKIRNDISKGKDKDHPYHMLYDAYKNWETKDTATRTAQENTNTARNLAGIINEFNNDRRGPDFYPTGPNGIKIEFKTNYPLNKDTIAVTKEMLEQWKAGTQPVPVPMNPATGNPATPDDLESDIKAFEGFNKLRTDDDEIWRTNHPDTLSNLVAYWNMLESYGKTHSFRLGSMKTKRKAFLENWVNKQSEAQNTANLFISEFGSLRAA